MVVLKTIISAHYIQKACCHASSSIVSTNLAQYASLPEIHLNQPSNNPSGGKFWRCTATPNGIDITCGRWRTTGQTMHIEAAQCGNADPIQELFVRSTNKLEEGYSLDRHTTFIPEIL